MTITFEKKFWSHQRGGLVALEFLFTVRYEWYCECENLCGWGLCVCMGEEGVRVGVCVCVCGWYRVWEPLCVCVWKGGEGEGRGGGREGGKSQGGKRSMGTQQGRTSHQKRQIDQNIFSFSSSARRTNNANNANHYVALVMGWLRLVGSLKL